jgi:hypothetical protein
MCILEFDFTAACPFSLVFIHVKTRPIRRSYSLKTWLLSAKVLRSKTSSYFNRCNLVNTDDEMLFPVGKQGVLRV